MASISVTATDDQNQDHTVTEDGTAPSGQGSTGAGGGASTSKTEPNTDGGTTETNKEWKPKTGKVNKVSIKVTLNCPGEHPAQIILEGSGNVSVSGSVEGQCINVTEVNTTTDASGVVTTVTTKKRKCCQAAAGGEFLAAGGQHELRPVSIRLDRATVEGIAQLKRLLG